MGIEITASFERALDHFENSDEPVFLTGKAGTGKSTLLRLFLEKTEKKVAVLAPTGVAALNVGGQTVHSFFKMRPQSTLGDVERTAKRISKNEKEARLYKRLDIVVVDEVSMLRADLADCMDVFLRTVRQDDRPFGGLKIIFIGDLYQLPPVVGRDEKMFFQTVYNTPHFFSSRVVSHSPLKRIELDKVYRQKDQRFIDVLNRIRNNEVEDDDLTLINRRVMDEYYPEDAELAVILTSTNQKAGEVNLSRLRSSREKSHQYVADVNGDINADAFPSEKIIELKKNAQVMLLNNDMLGRWVNGSMGRVRQLRENSIEVELDSGEVYDVEPHTWEIFRYQLDESKDKLKTEVIGTFTQLPVKLAWAVTIHKSQGKTFDKVILDLERGIFAPGQLYVALSRCRSLEGLTLTRPVKKSFAFVDEAIIHFMNKF